LKEASDGSSPQRIVTLRDFKKASIPRFLQEPIDGSDNRSSRPDQSCNFLEETVLPFEVDRTAKTHSPYATCSPATCSAHNQPTTP